MPAEAISLHLRNAHELSLVVPLKGGFVEGTERLTSYASRLRAVLALLFGPTKAAVERSLMPTANSIEMLQNIYSFHYGVTDRFPRAQLVLGATFDSSWETYFHNLVDGVGPFLDVLFCHGEGFEGRACSDGFEAFADFVRQYQVQSGIFYSATPDLTIDDLRLLRRRARGGPLHEPIGTVKDENAAERDAWEEAMRRSQGGDFEYWRNRGLGQLLGTMWDVRKLFPDRVEAPGGRKARDIFDAAARQLAGSYLSSDSLQPVLVRYLTDPGASSDQATGMSFFLYDDDVKAWVRSLVAGEAGPSSATGAALPSAAAPELTTAHPDADVAHLGYEDLADIQGNILEPYWPKSAHGLLVFVQLPIDDAKPVLAALAERMTSAARQAETSVRLNVGVTARGLRRVGLDEATLAAFPKEFMEGLERRAGALGDVGFPSHPGFWEPLEDNVSGARGCFTLGSVDLLLTLQAPGERVGDDHLWSRDHPLHEAYEELVRACLGGATVLRVEVVRSGAREPFDLVDPEHVPSQPEPRVMIGERRLFRAAAPSTAGGYDNTVALGELLLGHPDRRREIARCADPRHNPASSQLFKNGSFLVVRKMPQDRAAWNAFVQQNAERVPAATGPKGASLSLQQRVAHAVLGADRSGRSTGAPPGSEGGAFDYADDPTGTRCPLHAHVRRTNPRTRDVPRIMRRGFSYGCTYEENRRDAHLSERGHMFMAYNAKLCEQYEVIQRWMNGGNSTGLLSTKGDLLGHGPFYDDVRYAPVQLPPSRAAETQRGDEGERCPADRGLAPPSVPLVTLAWGLYLFAPSKRGLELLADAAGERATSGRVEQRQERERLEERGRAVLRELESIESPALARAAWKRLLEEYAYAYDAAAVWSVVRAHGGRKRTPYGLLVGDAEGARLVLGDRGARFSVREYWHRLTRTIGEFYLGVDPEAGIQRGSVASAEDAAYEARLDNVSYARLATIPNACLREAWSDTAAFESAREIARKHLSERTLIDVRDLAKLAVGELAAAWIGVPAEARESEAQLKAFVDRYSTISRYCFFPYPEPWLAHDALHAGEALRAAYERDLPDSPFDRTLVAKGHRDPASRRLAMIGANVGFVPPSVSLIVYLVSAWVESGELEQIARAIAGLPDPLLRARLFGPVAEAIELAPTFTAIYRTALDGNPLTIPGDRVVVGLGSACVDARRRKLRLPYRLMFGGAHAAELEAPRAAGEERAEDPTTTAHGCPMREPAIAALMGVIAAVAEQAPLVRESPSRFYRLRRRSS